jgi:hypothetical protein
MHCAQQQQQQAGWLRENAEITEQHNNITM